MQERASCASASSVACIVCPPSSLAQLRGQRRQRRGARTQHQTCQSSTPVSAPARSSGTSPARTSEDLPLPEAPARATKPAALELLKQALDLAVATKEERRILLAEHLQSAIGRNVLAGCHRHIGPERDAFDRVDQILQRAPVIAAAAKVNPRTRAQEMRQAVGIKGSSTPGNSTERPGSPAASPPGRSRPRPPATPTHQGHARPRTPHTQPTHPTQPQAHAATHHPASATTCQATAQPPPASDAARSAEQ